MEDSINALVFTIVVAARLLVPLWIPRIPIPAILAALMLDGIDGDIFSTFTTLSMDEYQSYDKALDIYYLTIAYLAAVRNWTNTSAVRIAQFLFYYRLVGVVLFEYYENRSLLLIFPNTFEYFFIAYEVAHLRWNMARAKFNTLLVMAAAIWIVIKLPQEYWLHIAQRDVTDTLAANPILIPILAVVIASLLGVGYWVVTQKLPPANRKPAFRVSDHVPFNHMQEAMLRYRSLPWKDQGLWEKVVLITLVSSVFSMILPGMVLTGGQLVFGIAVVVILNTIVSEILTKREMLSVHDIRHFLAMVAINMALAVVLLWILPNPTRDYSIRLNNSLFFFFLVSLLVTLFDRFRAIANMRNVEIPGPRVRE